VWSEAGHLQPVVWSAPSTPGTHCPQPRRGDDGERIQGVAQRFANHLAAVQGPYRRENGCGASPLPAPRGDELMASAPRQQRLEEQGLRCSGNQSGAKCTEDWGIKPWLCPLHAQDVFLVDAAAHRVRGLAVR